MEPNTPTPGKTRSLKLTVSFIAFLAVIPLLVFVAFLSLRESQEKEQERLWLLSRSRASIAVSGWFDAAYRHELLSAGIGAGTQAERAVPDEKMRAALAESFPDKARDLGLPDAALFWNTGTEKRPALELLSRVGTADATANVDVVAVAQTGESIRHSGSLGVGASHTTTIEAIIPLPVGIRARAVARLVLPEEVWTVSGDARSAALAAWVEETRYSLEASQLRKSLAEAIDQPLRDPEMLRKSLEKDVEALRQANQISGLTVFLAGPVADSTDRALRPWLRSGATPQQSTTADDLALKTREAPRPVEGDDPAVVVWPLYGNVTDKGVTRRDVIAVAHFQVPPPPPRGGGSRFILIIMIAMMALVLGFLFFYMNQAISQPIQRLIGAMTRGTTGDLQPIAKGWASGEVAQLALIYNRMAQENRKLLDQIRGFNEELKNKVRLATGELERRNDELRRANERLFGLQRELSEQQRLASLGQLAGTMAHELGTPLNAMSGHIELLLADKGTLPPEAVKRLELIGSQIYRLSGIIQGNLQQLRAPAPHMMSVDLNALVQGIVSLVTPSVSGRKVAIRVSLGTDLPRVAGDPAQLEQVLMNLVNNALDAMPGGGSLDLLTATKEGMACLQVRDSGAGIPREDFKKIFDPFFTTKVPGKGTGLGLAICREIIKAHGGTIDVQSEPGKGSWFTVRLPATEVVDGSGIRKAADAAVQPSEAKAP